MVVSYKPAKAPAPRNKKRSSTKKRKMKSTVASNQKVRPGSSMLP